MLAYVANLTTGGKNKLLYRLTSSKLQLWTLKKKTPNKHRFDCAQAIPYTTTLSPGKSVLFFPALHSAKDWFMQYSPSHHALLLYVLTGRHELGSRYSPRA
uniref:Uncharacterized protein n=1 Tax=Sphaerodactylus townsendi TaxID=933632 RepID=A0ACB8G4Z2_9SAUR